MKASLKAALLSALVCPGAGHFLLRRHRTGCALLLVTLAALALIVNYALKQAQLIVDKILASELPLDPQLVAEQAALIGSHGPLAVELAGWILLACWLFGIVDSYRAGNRIERASAAAP